MNTKDYQRSMHISSTPDKVFEGITQRIPEWWSKDYKGAAKDKGDEFTVRFGSTFKTMRITDVIENKKVEWLCIDQLIEMPDGMQPLKNKQEWVGNKIIWEVEQNDKDTILKFKHVGLTPEVECWSVCEPGWEQTLKSFTELLHSGAGKPFDMLDDEHLAKAKQHAAKTK